MPNWRKGYQGPQRKYVPMRVRRARARNLLRRRMRRRYKSRRKPTVKSLARSVRTLFKRDDKKYFYIADPDTPVYTQSVWTVLGQQLALNRCPASDSPNLQVWNKREIDSVDCHLKTIRIHMVVEAHVNRRNTRRYIPYYIMLVKTTNQIGAAGGINMPDVDEFFDPQCDPAIGNRLDRFETFRNTQGPGSEVLTNTKVLKVWKGTLQTPGFLQTVSLDTEGTSDDTANPPGQISDSTAAAGSLLNCNYQATYPCRRVIKHTHKCNSALVKFNSATGATASNPINNHYYLVALGGYGSSASANYYNVSTMIKINFRDS